MTSELFLLASFVVGMWLAWSTIWSRKNTWVRGAAVAAFLAMIPLMAGLHLTSLSHPAPLIDLTDLGKVEVIAARMKAGETIWLWVATAKGPRYFVLPWNSGTARSLGAAMEEYEGTGRGYELFRNPDNDVVEFQQIDIPEDPPKVIPPPPVMLVPDH